MLYQEFTDQEFIDFSLSKIPMTTQGLERNMKYRMDNIDFKEFHLFAGNLSDKKVLSNACASFLLFDLYSKGNGPEEIYAFDYNPKQTAYNYLVKLGFENLSFDEFVDFLGLETKSKVRSRENKRIRKELVSLMPKQLRQFLPRNHELTKRDLVLYDATNAKLTRKKFENIKPNAYKVRFFVYNLNPLIGQKFSDIFPEDYFDFIYTSNVLDWICWHNNMDYVNIEKIFANLTSVLKIGGDIVVDHLVSRETILPNYIERKKDHIVEQRDYNAYKYWWRMYKFKF